MGVSVNFFSPTVKKNHIQLVAAVQTLRSPHIGRESSARQREQKYCTQEGSEAPPGENLTCRGYYSYVDLHVLIQIQ